MKTVTRNALVKSKRLEIVSKRWKPSTTDDREEEEDIIHHIFIKIISKDFIPVILLATITQPGYFRKKKLQSNIYNNNTPICVRLIF